MASHTGIIAQIERTKSSRNGNPAFFITLEDGTRIRTNTDSSWAYMVDDSMIGKEFSFTLTSAGRISYASRVED